MQQEIANQTATENQPFSFTIPANTFTDIDGDNLTYTLATETVLPSGITFDAATGTFSGTPSDTASGTYNLTVIASDSAGEKANDSFSLNVLNAVNGSSSETVNGTSGDDHINAGAVTIPSTAVKATIPSTAVKEMTDSQAAPVTTPISLTTAAT